MTGFNPAEPRGFHGRWALEGAFRGMVDKSTDTGRAKVQTPSQFLHPGTGHAMGKTEIGDTYEQLFRMRGAHLVELHYGHPYVEIAGAGSVAKGRSSRTTALDFRLNHKYGGELKTLNSNAKNKKTAIKKEEQKRKIDAAAAEGLDPLLVVQVVDQDNRTVRVYAYRGFASKAVSSMEHLGTYQYSREDFRNAQIRTGHWSQRKARAGRRS